MNSKKINSPNISPLISVTIIFFMWGFITSLNNILIPLFKDVYHLSHFQANVVQFAFFIAYFVCSFIYYLFSLKKKDFITKHGYKNTLVLGLMIETLACCLFALTAKEQLDFTVFLCCLFLMGIGLTFLQIAANPFVSLLGEKKTASSRLNLTQAFNSLGTTLGPALGGYFFFSYFSQDAVGTQALVRPYLTLAFLLLLVTIFIYRTKIDEPKQEQVSENNKQSLLNKPYVILGAIGIFFYVGAEVCVGSNLVSFMKETAHVEQNLASSLLSYYWGGAMIGRFLGAVSLSKTSKQKKVLTMLLLALSAFLVIYFVNLALYSLSFHYVWFFLVFMALNFVFFLLGQGKTSQTLSIFALVNIGLLICGICCNASVAVWSLIAIGLFNSIMWGNVFTLAIDSLGNQTSQASSILIMMIAGGAILPPFQGFIADIIGIRLSYFVPMLSYIYLCFYGLKGYAIGKDNKPK